MNREREKNDGKVSFLCSENSKLKEKHDSYTYKHMFKSCSNEIIKRNRLKESDLGDFKSLPMASLSSGNQISAKEMFPEKPTYLQAFHLFLIAKVRELSYFSWKNGNVKIPHCQHDGDLPIQLVCVFLILFKR